MPDGNDTINSTPQDERIAAILCDQLPRMITTALPLPKSRMILLEYLTKLLPELDRYHNWNNCDPETNGEYWLLQRVIPLVKVVVDAGANIGDWTDKCLRINPKAEIFCFEASPSTGELLKKRFFNTPDIHVILQGLGEKDGELLFHDHGAGSGLSSFISREHSIGLQAQQVLTIPCKRLVDIPELLELGHIDFLKIDTEGNEMPILRGGREWLREHKIHLIQFEYGGTWADAREFLADANALFKECGYFWGRLMQNSVNWIQHFDHRQLETFKYSNFIACSSMDIRRNFGL